MWCAAVSCAFAGVVLLAVGGIAATIEMRKYELRAAQAGKLAQGTYQPMHIDIAAYADLSVPAANHATLGACPVSARSGITTIQISAERSLAHTRHQARRYFYYRSRAFALCRAGTRTTASRTWPKGRGGGLCIQLCGAGTCHFRHGCAAGRHSDDCLPACCIPKAARSAGVCDLYNLIHLRLPNVSEGRL